MALFVLLLLAFGIYLLIRIIYNRLWSKNLTAAVKFRGSSVFEGDKSEITEVVENNKNLIIPTLEIDFNFNKNIKFSDYQNSMVSDKLYRRDVFSLGSKKRITRHLDIECLKRGYYTVESVGLMANDLFMVKKYLASFSQFTELYVYPKRIESRRISIPFNCIMGEVLSRSKVMDDPFEFGGIRDYMITDPMKFINWKASAKTGSLVVNLHDSSLSQTVNIILDTYDNASPLDDELNEESIRVVSALCERVMSAGIGLSVMGNGTDILNGKELLLEDIKGRNAHIVRSALARLCKNQPKTVSELLSGIKPGVNTIYVVVSKNINDDIIKSVEGLTHKNSVVWVIPYKDEKPAVVGSSAKIIYWNRMQ